MRKYSLSHTSFLISKLSRILVGLGRHNKVIAMKPFDFVCPPDNRYLPVFCQNGRVMTFLLCERTDFVRKVKCLHKIL